MQVENMPAYANMVGRVAKERGFDVSLDLNHADVHRDMLEWVKL